MIAVSTRAKATLIEKGADEKDACRLIGHDRLKKINPIILLTRYC